jgi:hypothetical protein
MVRQMAGRPGQRAFSKRSEKVERSALEEIGNGYFVIGAGLGLAACIVIVLVMWILAAISAICDEEEGVRDA